MSDRYWWPLEKRPDLERFFTNAATKLSSQRVEIDSGLVAHADRMIVATLKSGLPNILGRDSLPALCHLFVGWGDALYEGRRLTGLINDYAHRGEDGREFVYQAHSEGDFHPWQSFCYMVMGGVEPERQLTARSSMLELAANSRDIQTQAMEDLGHLLFSHAHLGLDPSLKFRFSDPKRESPPFELDLYGIIVEAVKAHHFGSFRVCRKFHLTEGLCAIVSRRSELEQLRPVAQGFFSGQMDVLILVHRILELADRAGQMTGDELKELGALRTALKMGKLFENHLYYVGHLVELACFGLRFGFELSAEQTNAAAACLNICNRLLVGFAPGLAHAEVLLPFSHYRRGLTLWQSAIAGAPLGLDAFTADIDAIDALPPSETPNVSEVFTFATTSAEPRIRFQQVLDAYLRLCADLPEPRGALKHFRRLTPAGWHRQLHYEFLDYGDRIGAEIHFENAELTQLLPTIRQEVSGLVSALGASPVFESRSDTGKTAKLALVFGDDETEPDKIVHAMQELMRATRSKLEVAHLVA